MAGGRRGRPARAVRRTGPDGYPAGPDGGRMPDPGRPPVGRAPGRDGPAGRPPDRRTVPRAPPRARPIGSAWLRDGRSVVGGWQ